MSERLGDKSRRLTEARIAELRASAVGHDDAEKVELCDLAAQMLDHSALRKRIDDHLSQPSHTAPSSTREPTDEEIRFALAGLAQIVAVQPGQAIVVQHIRAVLEGLQSEVATLLVQMADVMATATVKSAAPSAIAPKWLVQAGGEHYDTWLCATREDVRKAFCEALFGNVEGADADDINGYMEEFDNASSLQETKHPSHTWRFEDGWLGFITLNVRADDTGAKK